MKLSLRIHLWFIHELRRWFLSPVLWWFTVGSVFILFISNYGSFALYEPAVTSGTTTVESLIEILLATGYTACILSYLLGAIIAGRDFDTKFSNRLLMLGRSNLAFVVVKSLTATVLSLMVCVFSLVSVYLSTRLVLENNGIDFLSQVSLVEWIAEYMFACATAAILGSAVAILFRNTLIAIVVIVAYFMIVEEVISAIFPAVSKWLPGNAHYAILQYPLELTSMSDMLDVLPGIGIYLLYLIVLCVVALLVLCYFTQPLYLKKPSEVSKLDKAGTKLSA